MFFAIECEPNDWTPLFLYYRLYRILTRLIFAIGFPCFCLYSAITGKHRTGLGQRFGFYTHLPPKSGGKRIWLHASSVGEVQVAKAMIGHIKVMFPDAQIFLSAVVELAHKVAEEQIGNLATCFFAPIDLPGVTKRALARIEPDILICLETELWPTLLAEAHRCGVKIYLLNARLSERSFGRYKKIPAFMRQVLANFTYVAAILPADADRYVALGMDREKVTVLGNAKYESACASVNDQSAEHYRALLSITETTPVFICGSTHAKEEEMLIATYLQVKADIPDLIWLLTPRLTRRMPEIEDIFRRKNLDYDLFTQVKKEGRHSDIVIINVTGELAALYSIATFVFLAGSFVENGGHNLLEAAVWDKPVFYGPHMQDFMDAKEILESVGAGFEVNSPMQLAEAILNMNTNKEDFLQAGQRAGKVAMAQQGSARKQVELITQ